jgi:hypothetical protein
MYRCMDFEWVSITLTREPRVGLMCLASSTVQSTRLYVVSWRNFYSGPIKIKTLFILAASVPVIKFFPGLVEKSHNPLRLNCILLSTRRTHGKNLVLFGIWALTEQYLQKWFKKIEKMDPKIFKAFDSTFGIFYGFVCNLSVNFKISVFDNTLICLSWSTVIFYALKPV